MSTPSTVLPSLRRYSSFSVPSSDMLRRSTASVDIEQCRFNCCRNGLFRSSIASKSSVFFRKSHTATRVPWPGFWPRLSVQNRSISRGVRPLRSMRLSEELFIVKKKLFRTVSRKAAKPQRKASGLV